MINAALVIQLGGLGYIGYALISSSIKASHPNPPVYRDVNNDGIEDKIVQRKVTKPVSLFILDTLEEEVLFGVEVNGKRIYLSKEQFEECKQ